MNGFKQIYTLQPGEKAHLIAGVGAMVVHPLRAPKIVDAEGKIRTMHVGHPRALLQRTAPGPIAAPPTRKSRKEKR